jgi:hypothetical protein
VKTAPQAHDAAAEHRDALARAIDAQAALLADALACERRYPNGRLGELADRRRVRLQQLRAELARTRGTQGQASPAPCGAAESVDDMTR